MQNADLDGVLGAGGKRRREAKGKSGRSGKPAASPGRLAAASLDLCIAMSLC